MRIPENKYSRARSTPFAVVATLSAVALLVGTARAASDAPHVSIDPPAVAVGGLVVVRSEAPAASGRFDGRPLRFFRVGDASIALVGVDLDHPAGRYRIEVTGRAGWHTETDLEVLEAHFPEEHLQVPKTYTEPDPATLRRIEREKAELDRLWRQSGGERHWSGPFVRPTDGPAGSPFGLRRYFNGERRSPHAGIDFRAPAGAPVAAANGGRVVLASDLFFTGNTVVIDHGCGLFTLYVHLSKLAVRRGAMVDKGQTIGQVGMTGRATGPHLHFAARVGEARIDPAALLGRDLVKGETAR